MEENLLVEILKSVNHLGEEISELKAEVKELRKDLDDLTLEVRTNEENRQKDKIEMQKMFLTLQETVESEIEELKTVG